MPQSTKKAENAKGNILLHIFHHSNTFGLEVLVAFKDLQSYCKFESIEKVNTCLQL